MDRDASRTLFHPFESGELPLPASGARVLFLGARLGFRLPEGFNAELSVVQGFRPDFLALQRAGFAVAPEPQREGYDLALVIGGRHRGENETRLADAILRVKPDGLIVMAGEKTDGIASLRTRLERIDDRIAATIARQYASSVVIQAADGTLQSSPERLYSPVKAPVPVAGHLSKHHGVVFWLRRSPEAERWAEQIRQWYGAWPLIDRRFKTAPGMFSHDRVDPGSKLLAEALPSALSGKVADFCAGWGYLSARLTDRCPDVRGIDLYEADFASLEAARRNLGGATGVETKFLWHDLLSEPVAGRYDAIVMNPPFHRGRATEPEIGQRLIAVAAKALKNRGALFLVANKGLPYDNALAASFADVRQVAGDGAFKVMLAARR